MAKGVDSWAPRTIEGRGSRLEPSTLVTPIDAARLVTSHRSICVSMLA